MLANYLKIAFRNLKKQKGYSFINITGLAIGTACCLLIVLFVRDELSFDQFHTKANRIYHLSTSLEQGGTTFSFSPPSAMGPTLVEEIPGVAGAVRVAGKGKVVIDFGTEERYEDRLRFTEPSFLEIFDFPLVQGIPASALTRPYTVLLTETMAETYFAGDNPVGQSLNIDKETYEITGILKDIPSNSHLQFNFLASFETLAASQTQNNWSLGGYSTYLLLHENYAVASLEQQIPAFLEKHLSAFMAPRVSVHFEPLTDLHFYSTWFRQNEGELTGDIRYVYIFSATALLILLIACVNFINLTTARAVRRAREVGIRKLLGAHRGQLIRQFLGESSFFSGAAMVLAVALTELFLPLFNTLVGKTLELDYTGDAFLLSTLAGVTVLTGVLAGSYPALILSSFRPAHVLKGLLIVSGTGLWVRKGLVVFQFAISVALIVGAIVIQNQLDYIQNKRLGFSGEQVVFFPSKGELANQYPIFKSELLMSPSITHVTVGPIPGGGAAPIKLEGSDELLTINSLRVDPDFLATLEIELLAGRDFAKELSTDLNSAVLVNETAVRTFGWKTGLGHFIEQLTDDGSWTTSAVVGVVKDFHTRSLKNPIKPSVLRLTEKPLNNTLVRIKPYDIPGALAFLQKTWEAFVPDYPFEYQFLDERYDRFYRAEERLGQIFSVFSLLAIVIACLGLFGLAAFTAERRTKEIGIRKTFGASISNIVVLLSKDFLQLVALAFVVAAPLAYVAMNRWLEDFAYHIDIGVEVFLLASVLSLAIALLTVSYQAIRAALADPVKALRYE